MIGILPAAGRAERFHGIPKYLLPVGDTYLLKWHQEQMYAAGVDVVYVVGNRQNMGLISNHLLDKSRAIYVDTKTMTETVLKLADTVGDETVLFGMPDTYFVEGHNAYDAIATDIPDADVVLGTWQIRDSQRGKLGMVESEEDGITVKRVIDKDPNCDLLWAWGIMFWKSSFWKHLKPDMPHVGYGVNPAIEDGLKVQYIPIAGDYWDCGTPDEYFSMIWNSLYILYVLEKTKYMPAPASLTYNPDLVNPHYVGNEVDDGS